jgi:hypothetical protein
MCLSGFSSTKSFYIFETFFNLDSMISPLDFPFNFSIKYG